MLQQLHLQKNKVSVDVLKRHKNCLAIWITLNTNTQTSRLINGCILSDTNQPLASCPASCSGSSGLLVCHKCIRGSVWIQAEQKAVYPAW